MRATMFIIILSIPLVLPNIFDFSFDSFSHVFSACIFIPSGCVYVSALLATALPVLPELARAFLPSVSLPEELTFGRHLTCVKW